MSAQMTIEIPNARPTVAFVEGIAAGLTSALLAVLILAVDYTAGHAAATTPPPIPAVGIFTGSYVDGVPVYRMPSVEITAHREAN